MIRFKLILTALFWGGTFIAGRVVAREMEPFNAAFLRFLIASAFLIPCTWRSQGKIIIASRQQLLLLTILGLSGIFAYNYFFFSGLKHVAAGRASIIIANNPILISIFSVIFFKERMTLIRLAGILLSLSGAIIAITRGDLSSLTGHVGQGELLIFMCVISWVSYSLIGKIVMVKLTPLVSVTYSTLIGTLLLFIPSLWSGVFTEITQYSWQGWAAVFYLGFFGTVLGFLWYYQGIQMIGPMKASIFINFVPISAILLSFFILDEPLTLSLLIGALMVIAGIYFTNKSRYQKSFIS